MSRSSVSKLTAANMGAGSGADSRPTEATGLRVVATSPVCAEMLLERQRGLITANHLFYLRNHFPVPNSWPGLHVESAVHGDVSIALADLARFSPKSLVVTLECAGNGRSTLEPPVPGEQWGLGAVSTAKWSGIPLRSLLDELGVPTHAVEIVFAGADGFARSLPVTTATQPDLLLVTAMNDEPLPLEHGGPLRLLVPSWYAMASIKWLTRIAFLAAPFRGHFQVESYVIDRRPIQVMEVRAVITTPAAGATVVGSMVRVAGYAWSGLGTVTRVQLSDDAGRSWNDAELVDSAPPYGWTRWVHDWRPCHSGPTVLLARAVDSAGRVQPDAPSWNRLGYCNNASMPHPLNVGPVGGSGAKVHKV